MNRLEPMPPGAAAASTVEFGSLKDLVGRHPPRPRLALNIGITGHRAALLPEGAYEALRPLVDRVFDGSAAAVVLSLFERSEIDPDELKELRSIIRRKTSSVGPRPDA